jgi:hypothetical protein
MLNSKAQKRISDLAIKDESFRKYLADRGIQVDKLSELDPTQRAQHIRKIASIVTVREAFLTHLSVKSDTRVQKRSRKNVKLYSGASTLFAMLEGNPRLFIGVIGPLIDEYFKTGEKVTRARQNQELTKATSFFRILLKNIPCPPVKIGSKTRGLLSILDDIGKYFQSSVLGVEFNPEPHATFIVDSHTGDTLIAALGRALNAGAIVYIPDEKGELIINDLRGKRFRLNYLLAAHYQLPLLLGEDISLSTILKTRTPSPLLQEAEPE